MNSAAAPSRQVNSGTPPFPELVIDVAAVVEDVVEVVSAVELEEVETCEVLEDEAEETTAADSANTETLFEPQERVLIHPRVEPPSQMTYRAKIPLPLFSLA